MKNVTPFILAIVIFATITISVYLFLFNQHNSPHKVSQNKIAATPTILQKAIITELNGKIKIVRFPAYGISFTVPNTDKTSLELSGFDSTTENYIDLNTPDMVINSGGYNEKGAEIAITIENVWKGFTDKQTLKNQSKTPINVTTDSGAIPTNNPLVSQNTVRVFSYPQLADNNGWLYLALVQLPPSVHANKSTAQGITIRCIDYADPYGATPSTRCRTIVKQFLSTLNYRSGIY